MAGGHLLGCGTEKISLMHMPNVQLREARVICDGYAR